MDTSTVHSLSPIMAVLNLRWNLILLCLAFLTGSRMRTAVSAIDEAGVSLTPPRGWNSYDSYSWIISEEEFLENARLVSEKLRQFGYEYVVVDFLWYRRHVPGASVWSRGFDVIDEWGRPLPDPSRWPSTKDGQGFAPIAEKVHALGLKFGIHVMRGISTAAVEANSVILEAEGSPEGPGGRPWTARDIALNGTDCGWMKGCFMTVNVSSQAGLAFIKSLYQQYASWGVDFIKHDCVFGEDDFVPDEIAAVSKAILETGREIVYSLSPGTRATPELARTIANLTNLYRITSDDWDLWSHVDLHFDVARDFAAAGLIGAQGLNGGKSWPDLDMLPLGWLTDPGVDEGPHRYCQLTREEQRTQVTLWAMAKSPLMFGGDMQMLDDWTLEMITNPSILDIDAYSVDNMELFSSTPGKIVLMLASCESGKATNWSRTGAEAVEEVCWNSTSENRLHGCLSWSHSSELTSTQNGYRTCLDAEAMVDEISSVAVTSGPLSECRGKPSQTWEVSGGQLISSGGKCVVATEQQDDTRVWIARGSRGDLIVAFFNRGPNTTFITLQLNNVIRHFQNNKSGPDQENFTKVFQRGLEWQCQVKDVWSGDITFARKHLSASVPAHGTVLHILTLCEKAPGRAWVLANMRDIEIG